MPSRSRIMYLGAVSSGKASMICWAVQAALGMLGDVEVNNASAVVGQDEEDEEDAEGGGGHGEEVDRGQRAEVVVEEGAPGLRGWLAWPAWA